MKPKPKPGATRVLKICKTQQIYKYLSMQILEDAEAKSRRSRREPVEEQ